MISATIQGSSELVIKGLQALPATLDGAIATGLQRGLLHAARVAQTEFLSGPRPARLGIRTGRLVKSVTTEVSRNGAQITGRMGTNVAYAAYHEFGFHGVVSVRSHQRISNVVNNKSGEPKEIRRVIKDRQGNVIGFKESNSRALARTGGGVGFHTGTVRQHSRRVDYKGRPFIRPAIDQSLPVLEREINREVAAVGKS